MSLCATSFSINVVTGYMAAVYVLLSVSLKLNFLGEAECWSAFAKGLLESYPRTISFLK